MKSLTKNRNLIIAILLSVVLAVAGVLAFLFTRPIPETHAADNYGEFKADGYYVLDDVVFYAIKVKNVEDPIYVANEKVVKINGSDIDKSATITKKDGSFFYGAAEITSITLKDENQAITSNFDKYITLNYYPSYAPALDDQGRLQFVRYGETVILDEGESVLISFARQENTDNSLEEKLVKNENGFISDYVDFLTASVKFNEKTPESDATVGEKTEGELIKKMFGYVFSAYNDENENDKYKFNTKEEGLVQFTANYEHGAMLNEFNFSFYVFKKETYQRDENLVAGKVRPNTEVNVSTGGGNYVVDSANTDKFYGEYFYYYKNQKLAKLTYNPERYEVNISKTIHSTLTTYAFKYNKTAGKVVCSKNQNPSTEDVYARDIAYKENEDGTVTLYFKDIGIYDISYTAIYYKNNSRAELKTLNEQFNLKDRLTVFGAQATYNDHTTKQTELRNEDNSISADVTGKGNISLSENGVVLDSNGNQIKKYAISGVENFTIASTNQPQVKFLMNSVVLNNTEDEKYFAVYYGKTLDSLTEKTDLNLTSNFTQSGYYYVIVKHAYENLKTWYGTTSITSNDTIQEQYFLFEIKDQTPIINILKMDGEKYTSNKVMSGYYTNGVYTGSYHNGGIFIEKFAENSEFDLPTTFEVQKKEFGSDSWSAYSLEAKNCDNGNEENPVKKQGYVVEDNGHYKLVVKFGNASSTTRYFDVDKEQISGLNAYKANAGAGNRNFTVVKDSPMGNNQIWAINQSFVLNWNNKPSGAKISASYVRFAMENSIFADKAADYIINGTKIAADSLIRIADNPETVYSKPQSLDLITANEVLNLAGLYIFKIEDEAGNVAYYSIIFDNSKAVVLQGEEKGDATTYEIIKGFNNISSDTRVFFGKNKLVKLEYGSLQEGGAAKEYLDQIFANDKSLIEAGKNRFIFEEGSLPIFADFKINSVNVQSIAGGNEENKPITNLSNGYDIISITYDEEGNVEEKVYRYTINDESNNNKVHTVTVNTDKTGLTMYWGSGKDDERVYPSGITSTSKETVGDGESSEELSSRTTYYNATNVDILYLTWTTLTPDIDAYVDLTKGGMLINYYEMIYNSDLKTYEYAQNPTNTITITPEMVTYDASGDEVKIEINAVADKTLAGKYEIVRQYVRKDGVEADLNQIVGNDFVIRRNIFYVDRNSIITAPSGAENSPQVGAHSSIKFFDGVTGEIQFNELFRQAQNSNNAVIQTNKLPVGIYIPIGKYGIATYDKNKKQTGFIDNLKLSGNQIDQKNSYYAPFELIVKLQSPVSLDGYYINYIYAYDQDGYFKLFGWEKIHSADESNTPVDKGIYDGTSAYLTENKLAGGDAWSEGIYSLKIGTMKDYYGKTLQNFYFNFEVIGDEPEFDLTAQYPSLPNMEDKEIEKDGNGTYYTNAEQIKVSWADLLSEYMVKIDQNSIEYSINGGTWVKASEVANIMTNENLHYFTISLPKHVNNLRISMSFEVYGVNEENAKLFPGGKYTLEKTIVFDRTAPTTTIDQLLDKDTIKGLAGSAMFREIGDRYNISTSTGIYKYFAFATTEVFLKTNLFSSKSIGDTNRVYIKPFTENNKYGSSVIEVGTPLNPNSTPSNIFSEQYATTIDWTLYTNSEIDLTNLENNLTKGNYYEIVELDLAGNMTIYSVYICEEKSAFNMEYIYREKANTDQSATIQINKDLVGADAIPSREIFAIDKIGYGSGSYKYIRLNINGTNYLITPFNEIDKQSGKAVKAYNLTTGEEVELDSVILTSRRTAYQIKFYDAVGAKSVKESKVYTIDVAVASIDARLVSQIKRENDRIGVVILGTEKDAVHFSGEMKIYALNKETGKDSLEYYVFIKDGETFNEKVDGVISAQVTATDAYYHITRGASVDWNNYLFLIVWSDNFGTQYSELVLYSSDSEPDYRYVTADPTGLTDLNRDMQSQTNIVVSTDIFVNISNLYKVEIEKRVNNDVVFSKVELDRDHVRVEAGYSSYKLDAFSKADVTYDYEGGVIVYRVTATANLDDFKKAGAVFGDEVAVDIEEKVYTITIYNQFPVVTLRNANGENITEGLYNKTITHSEDVYISYLTGNEISESYGFNTRVYLRLRGSDEGFVEIPSSYTVSIPGTYDIRVENYNENGVLAKTWNREFVIANYDVAFYSVVKYDSTNVENPYQVIAPTGNLFEYKNAEKNYLINYHYILNSDSYDISVNNGVKAELKDTIVEGPYTTKIYLISSTSEAGGSTVKFNRQIAITVIPETNSILGNSFAYFMGANPEAVEIFPITTPTKDIYLYRDSVETSITLQWNSYYGIEQNVIYYQISRDGGATWSDKIASSKEALTRINLNKSGNYVIMFTDLAGNTQTVSSSAGVRDRYRINFIKSVIFLVNGETPIDNAVYNDEVEINIPSYTHDYYQYTPIIVATLNGEEFSPSKNEDGNYVFTEAGTYVVYFNAIKGGNELGINKLTFTIINENDSRWAFNYVNYNNYNVEYVKYNNLPIGGEDIFTGNEILMSVVLGNDSFDNGVYSIKMTTNELPQQSFEFSFWLNNAKPDIQVSEEEGVSTTNNITVSLNANNLYETVGDCKVVINGREIVVLNKEYFEVENYEANITEVLTETSPYYIQVYTDNGKLIYSYKVEIVDPLNTITIILIVVACVVVAVGVLLFILLRKKLRIK